MLNVWFGKMPEAIYDTSMYFKNTYKDSWLNQPLVKEMIMDVDRSVVLNPQTIESPVLGQIPPEKLSGGVKTLILLAQERTENIFNASTCGDNCAKWILKIAEKKKLVINLRHLMDFGSSDFKLRILNNGTIAHNMEELLDQAAPFLLEEK